MRSAAPRRSRELARRMRNVVVGIVGGERKVTHDVNHIVRQHPRPQPPRMRPMEVSPAIRDARWVSSAKRDGRARMAYAREKISHGELL